MEIMFHDQFYREMRISLVEFLNIRKNLMESFDNYLFKFWQAKRKCFKQIVEFALVKIVVVGEVLDNKLLFERVSVSIVQMICSLILQKYISKINW